jgi:hypothetical protein
MVAGVEVVPMSATVLNDAELTMEIVARFNMPSRPESFAASSMMTLRGTMCGSIGADAI